MSKEQAKMIERALSLYIDVLKLRMQLKCMTERDVIDECVNSWLKKYIPEGARWPDEDCAQDDESAAPIDGPAADLPYRA